MPLFAVYFRLTSVLTIPRLDNRNSEVKLYLIVKALNLARKTVEEKYVQLCFILIQNKIHAGCIKTMPHMHRIFNSDIRKYRKILITRSHGNLGGKGTPNRTCTCP